MTRAKRMWMGAVVLGLMWFGGGCETSVSERDVEKAAITPGEVYRLIRARDGGRPNAVLILDPRGTEDFAAGHVPGAVNVPLHAVRTGGERDARWEAYSTIVVYGADPGSAAARGLAKRLMGAGYRDVRFMRDGFAGWSRAEYPVERVSPHGGASAGTNGGGR
jgi:rhodanese-related sulfurtransferase